MRTIIVYQKFLVSGTKLKRAVVQMKGESGESRTDAVVALYLTIYQRILDQPISVLPIRRTDWGMVHWIFLQTHHVRRRKSPMYGLTLVCMGIHVESCI